MFHFLILQREGIMSAQESPTALQQQSVDREKIYMWVIELANIETRENALLELRSVI